MKLELRVRLALQALRAKWAQLAKPETPAQLATRVKLAKPDHKVHGVQQV